MVDGCLWVVSEAINLCLAILHPCLVDRLFDQLLTTVILALIQGFAEWLPISSTGHLLVAEHFLGFHATPFFNLFLHTGTLLVVAVYFRHDIKMVLTALVHRDFHSDYGRLLPLIIVATIPTAIIGLLYSVFLADSFHTLLIIGITYLVGATLLFVSKFGKETVTQLSYRRALVMGAAQGASIFPGLSRSGSTISAGLLQGVKRDVVFRFSFLLSIPAILGNLVVEAYLQKGSLVSQGLGVGPVELVVAFAVTVLTGYVAIALVRKLVLTRRFYYFALYGYTFGIILIIISLLGL